MLESQSFTSSQSSPQGGSKSDPGRFEGSSGIGSLPTLAVIAKEKVILSVNVLNSKEKVTLTNINHLPVLQLEVIKEP